MRNIPLMYAAFFAIAVLALFCVGLGALTGSRPAFVVYVIGVGVIVSTVLVIRGRRRG